MIASWHHTSLAVTDVTKSVRFYEVMFGFKRRFEAQLASEIASITAEPGLSCDLVQLQRDGEEAILELIAFGTGPNAHQKPIHAGTAHVSFLVDSLDSALERLEQLNGKILGEVVTFSEGKSAYCQEPGGSFIELEELKEG